MERKKKGQNLTLYLQCGVCGAIVHGDSGWEPYLRGDDGPKPPKFCPRCSAAFDRYCLSCNKRVAMYFEEWWPEDRDCNRSYSPASFCPNCKADLQGKREEELED